VLRAFLERHDMYDRPAYAAQLVLEEAITNIVRYAFDDERGHMIAIEAAVVPDALMLVFEDDGRPFDPCNAPEPPQQRSLDEAVEGGIGIHLMRKMSQSMRYRRSAGRNRLEVRIARK